MIFNDEKNSISLTRANLDIECLRENLLVVKNYMIDQAGLLKVLEAKSDHTTSLKYENLKLKEELARLKENEASLPQKFKDLEQIIQDLKFKLQSQELINQQVRFNNEINVERIVWNTERKNNILKLSQKERQISTLKSLHEQLTEEMLSIKQESTEKIQEVIHQHKKIISIHKRKIKSKKSKIKKQKRMILNNYIELEKYKKKYKNLKKIIKNN